MSELVQKILTEMPPEWRFRPEDGAVIQKHKDLLLSLTEELVQGFYDGLFAHPATRAVFREGERPQREETLRAFWIRVAQGPHDEGFWRWMAWVGVVHIRRRVKNPMMLAAWGYIVNLCHRKLLESLPAGEAQALLDALVRLGKTTQALIAEGYLEVTLKAVQQAGGMSEGLLDTLVAVELASLEKELRGGEA